jgi:2'-5' RNA ligase
MSRLFVAVWPPAAICDHVRRLPRDGWTGVRWTPEENWHVTLRFLGEAEPDEVKSALAASDLPSARAEVSSRLVTLGSHSLVVPVNGVDHLAAAVRHTTAMLGSQPTDERFRGHLTVGRAIGRRRIVHQPPRVDPARLSTAAFDVFEVALVASALTPEGARYSTIARFPTVNVGGR